MPQVGLIFGFHQQNPVSNPGVSGAASARLFGSSGIGSSDRTRCTSTGAVGSGHNAASRGCNAAQVLRAWAHVVDALVLKVVAGRCQVAREQRKRVLGPCHKPGARALPPLGASGRGMASRGVARASRAGRVLGAPIAQAQAEVGGCAVAWPHDDTPTCRDDMPAADRVVRIEHCPPKPCIP